MMKNILIAQTLGDQVSYPHISV